MDRVTDVTFRRGFDRRRGRTEVDQCRLCARRRRARAWRQGRYRQRSAWIGGAVGAVATGGAWSLMLWREMGNPIFPLSTLFQSRNWSRRTSWTGILPRDPGRAGLSLLLAGRRQQELGISVPRRAVCGRDGADRARHRPKPHHRTDIFTRRDTQFSVLAVSCDGSPCFRSSATRSCLSFVCALDRPADCTLHRWRAGSALPAYLRCA